VQSFLMSLIGAVRKSIFTFALLTFISLSGIFIATEQPALALQSTASQVVSPSATSSTAANREAEYEKEAKAATSPEAQEEAYEEDLEQYKEANPDAKTGLVEGAKELVEKVTGDQ